jgi:NitT/TauT family transport system substrate-binding protein
MNRLARLLLAALLLWIGPSRIRAQEAPLVIGLMPAVNSAPLIVAEHLGAFARRELRVQLELFQDQLQREAALQTGRLDGSISDLINAVSARSGGFQIRVVSVTDGVFALLGSPGGPVGSIEDWRAPSIRAVRTGLLETSIVSYLTEKMLLASGADPGKVELVSVLQLPARLELLLAGRLDAACLPEPVASAAVLRGARLIADSRSLASTPGVLVFTEKALKEKAGSVAALLDAYDEAVEALNRTPDAFRSLLVTRLGFPETVRGTFLLPRFRRAGLPTPQEAADVMSWMRSHRLLREEVPYSSVVATVRRP